MLQYAGYDLLLGDPDGELQEWLDRYRPLDDIFPMLDPPGLVDGRSRPQGNSPHGIGLPTFNWSRKPPRWKLNTLWHPTGASRFTIGLFVTDYDTALRIQTTVSDNDGAGTFKVSDGINTTLSRTLYLLPPRPLAPTLGGANPPMLLPLVDIRYFWQWSKCGAFVLGPTSVWSDVTAKIIENLTGVSSLADPEAGYASPDWSEWTRQYENAAVAADAYAASTGQRFIVSLTGTASVQKWTAADDIVDANFDHVKFTPIAGGEAVESESSIPGKLTVAFPRRQGGIVIGNGTCYTVTKNAGDYGFNSSAPGEAVIHTTFQADVSTRGGSPDNAANCATLAGQIATDFYGWKTKQYGVTLPGVANWWNITGFDDFAWIHFGHQVPLAVAGPGGSSGEICGGDSRYTCHTIIESFPHSLGVEEQTSQSPSPTAPRTFRPMPVFRAELTTDFAANGDGVLEATARLLYDASGTFAGTPLTKDPFDVTVFDTLGIGVGQVASGDKVWVTAPAADSEMFELISGGANSFVVFQLTATLALAGEAAAVICELVAGEYDDTATAITVCDPYSSPGEWSGVSGYRGIGRLRSDGKYDVIWMERIAMFIELTLTANLSSGSAACDVDYYSEGKDPGATTTVYDPQGLFARAVDGAAGTARYNNRQGRYEAIHIYMTPGYIGNTDAAIAKGASGTVSRLAGGTEADTGINDTVKNLFADIDTLTDIAYIDVDGTKYAIAKEC